MRIVLIGFGSVGQSFHQILAKTQAEDFKKSYGFHPRIVAVVDRRGAAIDPSGLPLKEIYQAKNLKGSVSKTDKFGIEGIKPIEVIDKVEAEIMIEATSTNLTNGEPGLSNIKRAIMKRMHVITVNKGPLALAMPFLMELAEYNGVILKFSGTVGGGTPILKFAKECLEGDKIISLKGILNGTTNYILTEMGEKGLSMQQALKEAQNRGYAETDPSYDIEGLDTACKLVILSNWILNKRIALKDVNITGITKLTEKQVHKAEHQGKSIKLIGSAGKSVSVKPEAIPKKHPICIDGILNAITFNTELGGEITIVGKGAGGTETACSIIRDLVEIKRTLTARGDIEF